MSYFGSIHKSLRGSWIGHIEGPWSLSCSMKSFIKLFNKFFWCKLLTEIFDDNFGQQVFFIKRSKATCAVIREEFPPVRLNSHRHVARQQIFTYSPFACNNKTIDSSSLARIFLWLLIVATVCSTSCIFCAYLLLAPSAQACRVRKAFLTLSGRFWALFVLFLDSFWTIWTNYRLLREFE